MTKQDPASIKSHPSTTAEDNNSRDTEPTSTDSIESPPPYTFSGTPSSSTTIIQDREQSTPLSPIPSRRSSTSSFAGEDVPLRKRIATLEADTPQLALNFDGPIYIQHAAADDDDDDDDDVDDNHEGDAEAVTDEGYTSPKAMQYTADRYLKYEEEVGCFGSTSGGICCSDHAGVCCSSYGGLCCSSHGGIFCSSYGGICCSEGYPYKKKLNAGRSRAG